VSHRASTRPRPPRRPIRARLTRARASAVAACVAASSAAACSSAGTQPGNRAPAPPSAGSVERRTGADADTANLVPAGYGTLRQDDIAIRIALPAVQVRVLPLDEPVIRLLSPDSYRALSELKDSKAGAIAAAARRYNLRRPSLWYLSFYGLEPEARFSPMEVVISSAGREFRPVETIPLTAGFGEQRIRQRETQAAVYVFEDAVDVAQPLTVAVEGTRSSAWNDAMLRTINRERALVRSRAGRAQKP
jgi:hypothetical protein